MSDTVLIIEDNEQNMYLFTYLLKKNGFHVIPATNGVTGIELANTMNPTLILLDIQLPDMDGYQIAQELRLNQKMKAIPIIAVTSYAMVGDREKALASGCTGYIEKPINPETFIPEIMQYIT